MIRKTIPILTAALLAAGLAVAQPPARPRAGAARRPAPMGGVLDRQLAQRLNLTDSQKEQAKAIFAQARETAKPIQEQLKQNRQSMQAAMKANDSGLIRSLSAEQGTLHGQALAIQADAQAKFRALLTPEQQAKADQIRQKVRNRVQNRLKAGRKAG
jgi:periplasmic protein CpxP/Spy